VRSLQIASSIEYRSCNKLFNIISMETSLFQFSVRSVSVSIPKIFAPKRFDLERPNLVW